MPLSLILPRADSQVMHETWPAAGNSSEAAMKPLFTADPCSSCTQDPTGVDQTLDIQSLKAIGYGYLSTRLDTFDQQKNTTNGSAISYAERSWLPGCYASVGASPCWFCCTYYSVLHGIPAYTSRSMPRWPKIGRNSACLRGLSAPQVQQLPDGIMLERRHQCNSSEQWSNTAKAYNSAWFPVGTDRAYVVFSSQQYYFRGEGFTGRSPGKLFSAPLSKT